MTLKDIAKEARVSSVTVSNVINGRYNKVSAETVKKVQEIIEKYNYKPNATARSLAMKESKIIGVVIPNVDREQNFLQSPYNAEILSVLENYVRKQGYYLMIRCVSSCLDIIPLFSSWNVDGMVFLGALKDEIRDIKNRMDLPLVFIDTYTDDLDIVNVGANDYKGGYLATKYLIARGHQNIAFAGPDVKSQGVIQERYRGLCDAMEERELKVIPERIFVSMTTYESGVSVGKNIAFSNSDITAVVSMSDILALGIMEGLRLSGKLVPEDISVIGFDNLPECRYSNPQLTSVSQNIPWKAERAAEFLFQMIREKPDFAVDEKVDVEIVERQSVRTIS